MANEYHVLSALPARDAEEWDEAYETLTRRLVASGLLRINADHARNFVSYNGSDFDKTFSKRQMLDPQLSLHTQKIIAQTLPGMAGEKGVMEVRDRLLYELKKAGDIPLEQEINIARLLVQSTHPMLIEMALLEQVEIFVSYSHNIADLMAIHFWDQVGKNSGMQSISGDGAAIYVSCGGDPFFSGEHKTYVTDGFPALARLMVIAAQEFGHYADIMRNDTGQVRGRYSVYLYPEFQAREHVRNARVEDGYTMQHLVHVLRQSGVYRLAKYEKAVHFFKEKKNRSLTAWWYRWKCWLEKRHVKQMARQQDSQFILSFPEYVYGGAGWGTNMTRCVADMLFNLAPKADAYQRHSKQEEEAVACIEALARVPQQAVKWSDTITRICWPNLHKIYHREVIAETICHYERLLGRSYEMGCLDITISKNSKKWWKKELGKVLFRRQS